MDRVQGRRREAVLFIIIFTLFFGPIVYKMGLKNMLSTIMYTAHDLLLNTVFYILSITVLSGAFGKLLIEFGVVRLLEAILSPLMRPLFNLPGVASLGGLMTFFSDNPAIISLSKDKHFYRYFKRYQLISLTNFGTSFGMGLVVITFMMGKGYFGAAMVGLGGAIIGSIISTRLMQLFIKNKVDDFPPEIEARDGNENKITFNQKGKLFTRFLNAILDGGKDGVDLGLAIVPGVLIISTVVMLFTFGPKDQATGYQGLAYEGVPLLPYVADYLSYPFELLFGFKNPEIIAFPLTSLGSVGAALSLVTSFIDKGIITSNEIAVFTAMGMCWSGYLSTHSAMLDALKHRELTSKALLSHTIGGLLAGVSAHLIIQIGNFF